MKIIVLNGPRFAAPLRASGHEVRSYGEQQGCDKQLVIAEQSINKVLELAGFEPDLILFEVFGGVTPFFRGIEHCPYPMAAYALDSSINLFWMRHYLTLFDAVFVDQADAAHLLRRAGIRAVWLPLAINPDLYPSRPPDEEPEHDIVFVGRMTPGRMKRRNCIELLQRHFSVHVVGRQGDPWLSEPQMAALFARSKIVLNENLFCGVTMRVFQGMASGAMLLTESSGSDLFELFGDKRHLVTFTPENLLERAGYYLVHDDERRAIAAAGQAAVFSSHTLRHRVETILENCAPLIGTRPRRRLPYRLSEATAAYALLAERFSDQAPLFLSRAEQAGHAVLQNPHIPRRSRALALESLGRCLITGNHPQDALELLFEAGHLAPRNPSPCFLLGHLLLKMGQQQQAISFFQKGLRRLDCPRPELVEAADKLISDGHFHTSKIWAALARVLNACGKSFDPGFTKQAATALPESAMEYFHWALGQDRGVEGLKDLAGCYEQAGIWDLAYVTLLEALELSPGDEKLAARCTRAHLLCYRPHDPLLRREKALQLQRLRANDQGS